MDTFPYVSPAAEETRYLFDRPLAMQSLPTRPAVFLRLQAKHRRMMRLQHFSIAQVHMHAARQAGVETAHGTHNVDTLELVRAVLLEDRRILNRIFVRPRRSINIPRVRVPWGWRVGMIIGDLMIFNHHMVREYATHSLVETATDGTLGNFEVRPCFRPASVQFL